MDAEPRLRSQLESALPEFVRHSWVSESARAVWEPRIARIVQAWLGVEWLSVSAGIRECGIVWILPNALATFKSKWESAQLSAIHLPIEDPYAASGLRQGSQILGRICIVVGAMDSVEQLRNSWNTSNDEVVGKLLGYPPCCRSFFRQVWVTQKCLDTTWSMAQNSFSPQVDHTLKIRPADDSPPLANVLWRWLGVRAVPHLPCRFDCPGSIEFGRRLLKVAERAGYVEEVRWILEILSWPVEWSALHGICEIKTPVMKISTRTDATPEKWVVQWQGKTYPDEGAVGLRFPYRRPEKPMLTQLAGYQRGLADSLPEKNTEAWQYADNGFVSNLAMETLHQPIVSSAQTRLLSESGNVLDLGCGNGILLAKICGGRSDLIPFGVDTNRFAVQHARQLLPQFADNFTHGSLSDVEVWATDRRYSLAMIMLGRLLEVPKEDALRILGCLQRSCSRVLAYVYPDWSDQPLEVIARQLGVEVDSVGSSVAYLRIAAG